MKNEELLASEFNTTLDEVWNYAAIVQPYAWPPKRLILCGTLNVPQVDAPRQGQNKIVFEAFQDSDGKLFHFTTSLQRVH